MATKNKCENAKSIQVSLIVLIYATVVKGAA